MSVPFAWYARPIDSYPPIEYRGEDLRAVLARCACACGSDAVHLSGELLPEAVARHNATTAHAAWRSHLGRGAPLPTAGTAPVDVSSGRPVRPDGGAR